MDSIVHTTLFIESLAILFVMWYNYKGLGNKILWLHIELDSGYFMKKRDGKKYLNEWYVIFIVEVECYWQWLDLKQWSDTVKDKS